MKQFIYGSDGPRCESCKHGLKDQPDEYGADSWDPLFMPDGNPIRNDGVYTGKGSLR